ncbi:spore coat protein [Paractinoplanes deccanensis]|uniref:Spore coat protein n=1 Tax=Paractinoplanes deccanensis TaxID=113561 RepID=A0ABQ3YJN2_9ACTN|nr:DegT/DnrJ/EryC1/StrS family aminotransferase [Actinoplanes deccanensis]GID80209.1 spore coat protein [Actinoplanes deccanensis]
MTEFVVPYHGQGSIFDETDIAAVAGLLRSDKHLSSGFERRAFEQEFADDVGAGHAVSVTSCTMALELATHLLDLRPGDEVIASPLTFQATVSPLLTRGITVRFADVDPESLALDPAGVLRQITPRTRAVYITHYGGLAADLDRLRALADAHDIALVEDCAHALGTRYRGRGVGTIGDVGCWSFHSLKNMSTLGQGGMVTTGSAEWAGRLRRVSSIEPDADFTARPAPTAFGAHESPLPDDPERHCKNAYTHDCGTVRAGGTNAIMSEPAAAVGRTQLAKLPSFVARRRGLAGYLNERLGALPGVRVHGDLPEREHSYHLYTIRLEGAAPGVRDELIRRLHHEHRVEIILRYFPLHLLPEWRARGGAYGQAPVAERIWFQELINLPIYPAMRDSQVEYVADAVTTALRDVTAGSRTAVTS